MNMKELAGQYRESARLINGRIGELSKLENPESLSKTELMRLRGRILRLRGMYHDTCGMARMLEHYYDRRVSSGGFKV